ncbi:putative quinol monooxygenase [Cupriavidus basilensis]|uniref:putative quinol monooxygenase n=1 Tax=Cupriavidus basilensis TaxID=68895 RepID=UPI0023E7DB9E|nr:antibiotic biosynthesis monooxygenase [Cupriavidus basilensis]MDF3888394.1 antibiotic biosynthesis monooxygenase [Cupriavidus basilensis]
MDHVHLVTARPGSAPNPILTVIAHIQTLPGARDRVLALFDAPVPTVLAESGCGEYRPLVDKPSPQATERPDDCGIVIVEQWASAEALEAHHRAPHMVAYREAAASLVAAVSVRVLGR